MSELAAKRKTDRVGSAKTGRKLFQRILKNRWLYLLALPGSPTIFCSSMFDVGASHCV